MRARCVIGMLAVVLACQRAETPAQTQARMAAEADSVAVALDAVYARMNQFLAAENADSIAALYAEDARLYPQGQPMVVGRDAIRAQYADWFGMGSAQFENHRIGITANGPLAVERGTFTMTIMPEADAPPDTPTMTETGKYVAVWVKVDGQWLIGDDIGTSDRPASPPEQ
jgi:uncharacterized protein (TIGR02246 family)